ncbi:hypothetical protein JVT61DRAFT_14933 [Boletus reticuloceps]|uniref:SH3 domain-containing protein n=1 Tax=Boletus reticuloceps TaxID=495285 RepID=A0A8I2YCL2_9AGAM|nr:hypothetical protein JVT61DRAFT_14933 [Boletus reticuloceps]
MSVPHELQTAALLGHIASQMQLNVAFLESQSYLSPQDAATMKQIIGRLPVQTQINVATTTQVSVVAIPAGGGRVVPPPPRQVAATTSTVYARAIWSYNEGGSEANDLSFAAGDMIEVISQKNGDWWLGRVRGQEGLFPSNHVEKVESGALAPAPVTNTMATTSTGRSYHPFGAALHGMDTPPQNGTGVNSIGLQQASGQPEKKKKYGALGNTMANSAAGGVGFGAGGEYSWNCDISGRREIPFFSVSFRSVLCSLLPRCRLAVWLVVATHLSPSNSIYVILPSLLPSPDASWMDQSGTLVFLLFVPLLWVLWLAMIISKPAIIFHTSQIFFNFLAMACFASVASFQAKWGVGPSGLTGFALFVSISGILLSSFLMFVPVVYEKYDKFGYIARALQEVRVGFILTGTGVTLSLLIAFVTTISAWTEAGCKNASNDPHASLGSDFVNALPSWCSTKKAGSIFFWLAFGFWLASFVLLIIDWRSGNLSTRPLDSPFTRPDIEAVEELEEEPEETTSYQPVGSVPPPAAETSQTTTSSTPAAVARRRSTYDDPNTASSPFADPTRWSAATATTTAPSGTVYASSGLQNSGYATPPAAVSRPSLDAYGAFSDPAPSGFGGVSSSFGPPPAGDSNAPRISRTMQYADPYAIVRASLAASGHTTAPPSYEPYSTFQ